MVFEQQMKPDRDSVEWLPVVIKTKDEPALADSLARSEAVLAQASKDKQTLSHFVPTAFAPNPGHQHSNLATLGAIAADRERLFKAAGDAGFNERGLGLAKKVTELWALWAQDKAASLRWPDLVKLDDSIGRQLHKGPDGLTAVGFVRMPKTPQVFDAPLIQALQTIPGVHVAGWGYLTSQLKTIMHREVIRVLLPAAALLFVMFFFVFKGWHERVVAVGSIAFSGLILIAGMRLLNVEWNFVNIGTVPLCLGLGLDFNIHMIYSLRRAEQTGEDAHGIGRALAYCGLSTGLGFGALAMSDNLGLSTFGVCSMVGVLATLFVAAYIVPWFWVRTRAKA